ncbi:LysR family transcriptional regulator [Parasulfuritortus cantonensis]|uniref:LysR family transcriptional regulator n=1 Tax=Parasulfuritortus cantonensis TaxID=2528202 RepID=A0A4R1BF00_9PROT|nr:LysR family transcriptional regulator [Parasulfuritortus cantonensis]TCJ15756.1 LysR family transcriptional regulator [Parasulfuritortus cantonensis]
MAISNDISPVVLVRPRIYIGDAISIGPGKIDLLRRIGETQSIAAAARALGMPYKRAWLLIDTLNQGFGRPVVATATGGKGGGGTSLTALGQTLIECYDALEVSLNASAGKELAALSALAGWPA